MPERLRETIRISIPASEAVAVDLHKGYRVSVIDLAGHQGADCVAVTPGGAVSCTRTTRARNRRLFPKIGQSIYADDDDAMLTLLEDTSPGPHGLLVPPCDPTMYRLRGARRDRKSTRLNSSHQIISYAVFCLKKKKKTKQHTAT